MERTQKALAMANVAGWDRRWSRLAWFKGAFI